VTGKQRKLTLVGLGEILWDMLPDGKQLGGAPANFAYHAQALGGRGVVVSCVGDDPLGMEILGRLDGLGLDKKYIAVDRNHPTGTVTVELDAKGRPNYIIHENVAWDFIPSSPAVLELASKCDAVCFGSLCQRLPVSRAAIRQFLQANGHRCLRVFDVNIRRKYYSRDIIVDMLELSNVFKLNDEELPLVAEILGITGDETAILAGLTERFDLALIALTKGAHGSRLYSRGSSSFHPGVPVRKIADTVGAGDSFTAAITLGWLQGRQLDAINDHANRVAGFVCSQDGAMPALPEALIEA
jgi:fructokinase